MIFHKIRKPENLLEKPCEDCGKLTIHMKCPECRREEENIILEHYFSIDGWGDNF